MRLFTSVIASAIFLVASAASALTQFNVTTSVDTGHALNALAVGDLVTINVRLSGGTNVFGLGASVFGYNEAVADFQSGQSVANFNNQVCIPAAGCFNGLTNGAGGALVESAIGASGNRVQIFNAVSLTGTNSNAQDPGLDGVLGGNDAQARIVFRVTGAGTTDIKIGTGYNGDGEVGAGGVTDTSSNATLTFTSPVPEPGTALLMGLGLAGLATAGRRE